jgi:DNA primase
MSDIVVDILEGALGDHRRHNSSSGQIAFDCPACAEEGRGEGKGKLEVNYQKGIFRCWVCFEINNMHGSIPKLLRRYGDAKTLKDFLLVKPEFNYNKKDKEPTIVKLPEGFQPLATCNPEQFKYGQAMKYLTDRGITMDIIKEFNIGFTAIGKYANRIIIPSYDIDGELNYFVGRAFQKWTHPKYLNPIADKQEIVFNENKINWDSTIYLVEGAFDHIVVPNSIAILGKYLPDKLLYLLQTKAKANVVILLDGDAYDDALKIYKKLNTMNLQGKVKIIKMPDEVDISIIFEKYGNKGVTQYLRTSKFIPESELYH